MGTRNSIRPAFPVHPGSILKEELRERAIKQKEFAKMIGMQPTHLNALLHGARSISPQLAVRLEAALNIPASVWLNLQSNYNLDMLRPADVVDGYSYPPENKRAYVLADSASQQLAQTESERNESSSPDIYQALFRAGEAAGKRELLEDILNHLIDQGYTKEDALILIGQKE